MKKVCWNITSRCNKNCIYCFKFNKPDLSLDDNKSILIKLKTLGIKKIMWSGGEPYIYDKFIDLLKYSHDNGIYNCVNTNASLLTESNLKNNIQYVDKIIISLDFIDDEENLKYGIGDNYYNHVSKLLKLIRVYNKNIKIQINTVVFRQNYKKLSYIIEELEKYDIDVWKLMRFFPIRGMSLKNKDQLFVSDNDFQKIMDFFSKYNTDIKIKFNDLKDIKKKHYIVLSSGDLIESENGVDLKVDELV